MARGDKTKTFGIAAASCYWPALVDPTGISAVIFLSAGTGFAVGGLYHGTRKTFKLSREILDTIQEHMEDNRAAKAARNPLRMAPSAHIQFQHEVESTFRRLVAALGGVMTHGIMFARMPISGIAFFINVNDAVQQAGELAGLARRAGGFPQLLRNVSLENVVPQAAAGAAIKAITFFMFVGGDFRNFMDSIHDMADFFTGHPIRTVDFVNAYGHASSHRLMKVTTATASAPVDAMKDYFGHRGGWYWNDHNSLESLLSVGATVAVVDKLTEKFAERPMHAAAERVTAGKRKAHA